MRNVPNMPLGSSRFRGDAWSFLGRNISILLVVRDLIILLLMLKIIHTYAYAVTFAQQLQSCAQYNRF